VCLCFVLYYHLLKQIRSVNKVYYSIMYYYILPPFIGTSISRNIRHVVTVQLVTVILYFYYCFEDNNYWYVSLMVYFLISQNEKIATKPSDQVHLAMTIDMVARLTFPSAFVMFLAFFFFYYSVNANNRAISVGTDWTNFRRSQWSRSYHKGQSGHPHPFPHHNPLGWPDKNTTQNEGYTVMAHHVSLI